MSRSRTGSTYAKALLTRVVPSMLTGKGATPAFSSRLLRSFTAGIPFAAIASLQARWNGVSSSRPTRRTRNCFHAEANSG